MTRRIDSEETDHATEASLEGREPGQQRSGEARERAQSRGSIPMRQRARVARPSKKKPPVEPPEPTNATYQPTEAEAARVSAVAARRRAKPPSPRFSVEQAPPGPVKLDSLHPDPRVWDELLLDTFGATEPSFVDALVGDLVEAVHPNAVESLKAEQINRLVAAVHGIAPRDEIEAMLAVQMVATHKAAMDALRRLTSSGDIQQQDSNGGMATKLLRTYAAQLEALHRYRSKGQQRVVVEHVHVYPGGQAIVGTVETRGEGVGSDSQDQPHA